MGPPRLPNTELTSSERAALDVYQAFLSKHGARPSVRQFAHLLDVQPSRAWRLLHTFVAKGKLPSPQRKKKR